MHVHVQVSYFEIYMDKIRDLLDSKNSILLIMLFNTILNINLCYACVYYLLHYIFQICVLF